MAIYTTKGGIEYTVSRSGRYAYPRKGPAKFPADLWGAEAAQARGELVDRDIPRGDQRVRGAGPAWMEVYEHLRSLERAQVRGEG